MALRKTIETEGKVSVNTPLGLIDNGLQKVSFSAYVSVISVTGNKSTVTALVNFKGQANQFNKHYEVPVSVGENAKNYIAQVYEYLKTLPEFDGAVDC